MLYLSLALWPDLKLSFYPTCRAQFPGDWCVCVCVCVCGNAIKAFVTFIGG